MTTSELCERELASYLCRMTGSAGDIELFHGIDPSPFDEHYIIDVKEGKGSIRANRPRALLLGVYDFLRRCGCRFLRPGKDGEIVPSRTLSSLTVQADVTPANRHRGIAIEGAVSLENVLELIEWAPKAGFNSYFIQFRNAFTFFDRWYSHQGNDALSPEPFSEEDSADFVRRIVQAIKERDMIYHAVGHGWTAACVGADVNSWSSFKGELDEEKREMLASVGGKRGFFKDIPMNTHLCYSNPAVRRKLAEEVVCYAEAHPEVDVLHFWLADDSNNVCECEACGKKPLADWYVEILNEIDARLTAKGIPTKICFLVYLDLYWAPEKARIKNEDRFIMMFAPIFRTYSQSFDETRPAELLPYRKNSVVYPDSAAVYLRLLGEWKKIFRGDAFDFDYHLMWDINRDLGGEVVASVLYRDIRALPALGFNGFISCQIQRAFYPNGLAFYALGRALFDGEVSFEEVRKEYYEGAFGKDAAFAENLYAAIGRAVPFPAVKEGAEGLLSCVAEAEELIGKELNCFPVCEEDGTRKESLAVLRFAAENALRLANVLKLKLSGAEKTAVAEADRERKDFFNRNELRFQRYADGFYVNLIVDGLVESKDVGIYSE